MELISGNGSLDRCRICVAYLGICEDSRIKMMGFLSIYMYEGIGREQENEARQVSDNVE